MTHRENFNLPYDVSGDLSIMVFIYILISYNQAMQKSNARRLLIFSIQLIIAALHFFRLGQLLQGGYYIIYYSYFSDLVLPFGAYFLFCSSELSFPILKDWKVKTGFTFLLPAAAETCQYFGLPVLGSTFDPLDYLMYGAGALMAALVDVQLFTRIFKFWRPQT